MNQEKLTQDKLEKLQVEAAYLLADLTMARTRLERGTGDLQECKILEKEFEACCLSIKQLSQEKDQ